MIRVDAHQHFWKPERGDYGWLTPDLEPLYRAFGPEHLQPLLAVARIDATLLVQAAPTAEETGYLLQLAQATPWVGGVVGWIDLDTADAPMQIERARVDSRFLGVRPMLQDIQPFDWIVGAPRVPALEALEQSGLVFDALIRADQIATITALAKRHPRLVIVIDHAAKPRIASRLPQDWTLAMAQAAACPNIYCKLSGLLTEAPPATEASHLRAYVDCLLDLFGPDRLIWGSDWPVLTLVANYPQWVQISEALLGRLPRRDVDAVFGGNASAVYRLSGTSLRGNRQ